MEPSQESAEPSASPRNAKKRRRAHLACTNCRDRKTRCNGERPACSSCTRRGVKQTCIYEDAPIQRWERNDGPEENIAAKEATTRIPFKQPSSTHRYNRSSTSRASAATVARRVDNIVPIRMSIDNDVPIYGGSSASVLLSQIKVATLRSDGFAGVELNSLNDGEPVGNRYGESPYANRLEIIKDQDLTQVDLPTRDISDNLLSCYWQQSHPVFPVLHRPTFMASYEKMWISRRVGKTPETERDSITQTIFLASLNMVFAIGSHFTTLIYPQHRSRYGSDFYQNCRKLINFEILDGVQQSTIQLLLLMGVYLYYEQPSKAADRCWNVIGLAIRSAQGLGLHLDTLSEQLSSQLVREMRRRIWYCALLMDRLLSMTYGRPTVTSGPSDVLLPLIIDDEYLLQDGEGIQPPEIPSRMNLFVYTIQLFDIMDDILNTFYSHHGDAFLDGRWQLDLEISEALTDVFRIDARMNEWKESIPDFLQPQVNVKYHSEPWYDYVVLQSNILRNRFLNTKILLFRPILISAMMREYSGMPRSAETTDTSLHDSAISWICDLCVESAQALLDSLFSHRDDKYRSHVWHGVYYAFISALILIAGHICPVTSVDFNLEPLQESWMKSIAILRRHEIQMPSCKRAIAFLEVLKAQVCHTHDSNSRDLTDQHGKKKQKVNDNANSTAQNLSEQNGSEFPGMDYMQSYSNGINDIFENYDIWNSQTTGVDSLPWLGNWGFSML